MTRTGDCLCGLPISAHFDARNHKHSCEMVGQLHADELGVSMNTFACWYGVTEYCRDHAYIYYKAPMDLHAVPAAIVKVFKNSKVRLDYHGHRWTIDVGHLNRLFFTE